MTEQIAAPRQKRLQILGDDEIENLYGFPRFTSEEQLEYFTLLPKEFVAIQQLPRIRSRIYTILQLGYFKARHLFFTFSFSIYASLVTYYSVFRLKRLAQGIVHVYLLCFVTHRYQRLHDNLISSLRYNVRRYVEATKGAAKEQVYEYRIEGNQNLQKAGQVLKLFTDDSIAILHLFGYQFAPRYRDIHNQLRVSLYGFEHPSQYEDKGPLKPIRKINTALIIEEWSNIQRIMVSLALKTVTQSVIVGKLSAYARKNKTKRALWEYDNIIRSLYLLDYVDSVPLRQNVQRALNRGESYHQLRRAVSYANFGKLRFKSEYEQQIWGDCGRLLTNCIIYYNASILSDLLIYREGLGDIDGVALLSLVSPVAWQGINFYGRYEFGKQPELIDLKAIIQQLAQISIR